MTVKQQKRPICTNFLTKEELMADPNFKFFRRMVILIFIRTTKENRQSSHFRYHFEIKALDPF